MPPKNGVTIKLDRQRTLRFRARAWETFEKATGRNILSGDALSGMDKDLSAVVSLTWCGLLHEDPDLTRDQVADMLSLRDLQRLVPILIAAVQEDLPQSGGEKKGARKTASP